MQVSRRLTREMVVRMAADAVVVNLSLIAALGLRVVGLVWVSSEAPGGASHAIAEAVHGSVAAYLHGAVVLTPLSLAIFFLSGFYTYGRAYRGRYKALVIVQAVTVAYLAFGAILYLFFKMSPWFPRTVWIGGWALTVASVGGLRLWAHLWRRMVWAEAKIFGKPQARQIRSVTVIGGAGYIGSILVRRLLDRGYYVTVLDTLLYGDESIRELYGAPGFEVLEADFRNVEAVVGALRYADAVVHLGALVGDPACAIDEDLTLEINLAATRMIAEAARGFGVERFIFASTCSVYGASDEVLDEQSALNPVSLYARTKISAEQILLGLNSGGFAPTILRFATIYGMSPRPRFDLVVNLLAAQAVREKRIRIFGGDQWRPFVHVEDAAEAIVRCLEASVEAVRGQIFNVGSDAENYRLDQIAALIQQAVPDVRVERREMDGDRRNYRVTFSKIRRHLGYVPGRSVASGIPEIVQAIERGAIRDYRAPQYSNHMTLSEEVTGQIMRRTHITPLYAPARSEGLGATATKAKSPA